jgi:hypothetical protein
MTWSARRYAPGFFSEREVARSGIRAKRQAKATCETPLLICTTTKSGRSRRRYRASFMMVLHDFHIDALLISKGTTGKPASLKKSVNEEPAGHAKVIE